MKTYHEKSFVEAGIRFHCAEEFYSVSTRGVLRGMHFQTPPRSLAKLAYCAEGRVFDAVVDIRKGSPAYGKSISVELSAEKANGIYIPPGLAHGFYVLSDQSLMVYNVSDVHSPEHDSGIRWDSAGIAWPGGSPVLSPRDQKFPKLSDYDSPFKFKE